jgi:hypothetical protein
MFSTPELKQWLEKISKHLHEDVSIYMIGGGAMSFRGLKARTKDIDLIMTSRKEFDALDAAITDAGYKREQISMMNFTRQHLQFTRKKILILMCFCVKLEKCFV